MIGIFFSGGEMPSAESRNILTILLILSNCFFKIRIHSFFDQRSRFSGQRQR